MGKQNKPKTPEQIQRDYERILLAQMLTVEQRVYYYYNQIINEITPLAASTLYKGGVFTLEAYPLLNARVDQLINIMVRNVEATVRSGINDAWKLSNIKNDLIADIRLDKSLIPAEAKVTFYDPNAPALKSYQEMTIDGLKLSDRVYKAGEVVKAELEAGLGLGISTGQSAAEMGRDLRQYLKEPEKLFRRVRDEEGNLQLSKNAKLYKPGQGVYRSSAANIKRLTRTTINNAYRTADNARWQNMPFVIGQEIHTSASHPKFDICDFMAGDYPIEFVFIGWHPQCLCFTVPKLMNDKQFAAYQKLVLSGDDTPENISKIARPVITIPDNAATWLNDNAERVKGWKNPPQWWSMNANYTPTI